MVTFRIDDEITLREFREGDAAAVFTTVSANYEHLHSFMDWITPDYSIGSAKEFIVKSIKGREERTNPKKPRHISGQPVHRLYRFYLF